MNEYYFSSLGGGNTGTSNEYPTVTSSTATQTGQKYNTTTHIAGFIHSSLASTITNNLNVGDNSDTWSYISGADLIGNEGNIPESGTISFNHLRGTTKGTSSSLVCYGLIWVRLSNAITTTSTVRAYFAGHLGTNSQTNESWDGFPFTSITCAAEGSSNQFPATTFTFSGTHTANGAAQSKHSKVHLNNSTLGNYTRCRFDTNGNGGDIDNFSGTWSITFSGF